MKIEKVIGYHELEAATRDGWHVEETLHVEEIQYLSQQVARPKNVTLAALSQQLGWAASPVTTGTRTRPALTATCSR